MVLNRQAVLDLVIESGSSEALEVQNLWDQLRQSSFFTNYSGMYDQIKLDSIRLKLSGAWQQKTSNNDQIPVVTTAFDRNGFVDGTTPDASRVPTYSSALSKPWSLGSAFSQTRSLYSSTMAEKSQYIPCTTLANPATVSNCTNPCWNGSCLTCPFKPIYLVHAKLPTNAEADYTLHLTVEYDFCVTFRGLRKRADAYEGEDIYTLSRYYTGVGSTQYVGSDGVYIIENLDIPIDSETSVVLVYNTSNGLVVRTRRLATSVGTFNPLTVSGGRQGWYYTYANPAAITNNISFVFKEQDSGTEGTNIRYYYSRFNFVRDTWTEQVLPPIFIQGPDWYTADAERVIQAPNTE